MKEYLTTTQTLQTVCTDGKASVRTNQTTSSAATDVCPLRYRGKDAPHGSASWFVVLWWWLFPRVRGFWENVRQFIPRLRCFF